MARGCGDADAIEVAQAGILQTLTVLVEVLGSGPFLLGERFTAADVMIGSVVAWIGIMGFVELPAALQGTPRGSAGISEGLRRLS